MVHGAVLHAKSFFCSLLFIALLGMERIISGMLVVIVLLLIAIAVVAVWPAN